MTLLRPSPAVAHAAPLVLFMLITEVTGFFRLENGGAPWYVRAPEHWVYPLQCIILGAVLWTWRKSYVLSPWTGFTLAVGCGVVGIAVWLMPGLLYERWIGAGSAPSWWEWVGLVPHKDGFYPGVFADGSAAWWGTVLLRFVRMVIIVPLVEELFWRGFLMRYLQAGDKSILSVPFGQHSWSAFWVTTLAVTFVHHASDRPAAFVWGSLVYWVAVKTKSLGACVLMHAVGNLLLGLHIINTQQWGYW
ncbi:MAG: CAAX prenyl protease-related protein [Verrucomicrobiaceae bacterium]|nr:CAAX prenyl protease-related protein [Verrucomicrobiaceae bacterium]